MTTHRDDDLLTDELRRDVLILAEDVDGLPLALRVERSDGSVSWIDRVAGRHEIVLDADAANRTVWAVAFRHVEVAGHGIELQSDPVRLTGQEAGHGD